MILAVLSVVAAGSRRLHSFRAEPIISANFLQPVFRNVEVAGGEAEAHSLEIWLAAIAVAVRLPAPYCIPAVFEGPEKADGLAKSLKPAYTTLLNKYYVDELYAATVVRPLLWISTMCSGKRPTWPESTGQSTHCGRR